MMKVLKITVFVLAMLILTTQAVRHFYVRFIEPRTSVLDKYDQTETQKAIKTAGSLVELLKQYDQARKQTDNLDKQLKDLEQNKARDEIAVLRERFQHDHKVEYQRESDLKYAVKDWEEKSKEILELQVFWVFGFAMLLAGTAIQMRKSGWLGIALIISGLGEMIWWSSPSFRFAGSPLEFDRLLNNKLVFTLVTMTILVCWWVLTARRENK